jgi:hypothetical protein
MITTNSVTRIELPHEPGQWIEARRPSIKDTLIAGKSGDHEMDVALSLLQACVVAWSYGEAVTAENIAALDTETAGVVMKALNPSGAAAETDQKNDLGGSTPPSTAKARSQKSG